MRVYEKVTALFWRSAWRIPMAGRLPSQTGLVA
jgi:hypothetical protein